MIVAFLLLANCTTSKPQINRQIDLIQECPEIKPSDAKNKTQLVIDYVNLRMAYKLCSIRHNLLSESLQKKY